MSPIAASDLHLASHAIPEQHIPVQLQLVSVLLNCADEGQRRADRTSKLS
jgi:hypothetical protein